MSAVLDLADEAPSSVLQVRFVDDLASLAALAAPWEDLNTRGSDHDAPFFQSHPWIMHVARTRLARSPSRFRLRVAALWRGSRLVGVWPLALQKTWGIWIATSLDDPYGQFAGAAFIDAATLAEGIPTVIDALRADGAVSGMRIEAVVAGPLHDALTAAGANRAVTGEAVCVDLHTYPSYADYAATVTSKTRKNLRNLLSRLRREAVIEQRVFEGGPALADLPLRCFDQRLDWMRRSGHTSAAFADGDFRPLVEGITSVRGLNLIGFAMLRDGQPIASQWGFLHGKRYYAYLSSRDQRFDAFSAGRIHLGHVIEVCKARGIEVLELMPPPADYKMTWANRTKPMVRFTKTFTLPGWLWIDLLHGMLLPLARRVAHRLPPDLRRRLVGRMNHRAND